MTAANIVNKYPPVLDFSCYTFCIFKCTTNAVESWLLLHILHARIYGDGGIAMLV